MHTKQMLGGETGDKQIETYSSAYFGGCACIYLATELGKLMLIYMTLRGGMQFKSRTDVFKAWNASVISR